MRYFFFISILWVLILTDVGSRQVPVQKPPQEPLPAPTYYLAAEARTCSKEQITVHGVSNLPSGSVIVLTVSEFYQDGWKDYSDEVFASVKENGFFDARIHPTNSATFRRNLIVVATFTTFHPRQPEKVLRIVGKKGQNLGSLENPQLGRLSGEHYYLRAIARVPFCGESFKER